MNQLKEQMKQLNNRKYLIIAGCSYYWKTDKKNYPNDIPEAFLKGYAQIQIGISSSSIERIKESIIHTIGELLERGVDGSNIYLLSNITNIGRNFIKYPDYMLNSLSEYYKQENQIGKNIVSSLTLTANDEYKSKDVKRWEKNIISNKRNINIVLNN